MQQIATSMTPCYLVPDPVQAIDQRSSGKDLALAGCDDPWSAIAPLRSRSVEFPALSFLLESTHPDCALFNSIDSQRGGKC